ncbi:ORFVI [Mirabilis mosaic virus]|uniref:Transactivator/viroplasmin protein n=1 Tax=Mirabilis mosaic virus TaxID=194445 RepID=Q8JTA1_9VIRU|nr:hypothetical protein [Mirabilis mosaic virus]AAM53129.1 ORFVI [Mirabilis mosaic virus]
MKIPHKTHPFFKGGELNQKQEKQKPVMEKELQALRIKEKILLVELDSIRKQISIYAELTGSLDQEGSASHSKPSPQQTADGKDGSNPLNPDALGKSITENLVPSPEKDESKKVVSLRKTESGLYIPTTSPVANGSGKDTTNPLTADTLLKSDNEDINLRPSYASMMMKKPLPAEKFYVVYNGDHPGIYTDWAHVLKASSSQKGIIIKKFLSFAEANISASKYSIRHGGIIKYKGPIPILPKKEAAAPRRRLVQKPEEKKEDHFPKVSFEQFISLWRKARDTVPEDYVKEQYWTDDKNSRSLFIFGPNADPVLVFAAFNAGLIKTIYPSGNLQEIKEFPSEFKKAVKTFRSKIAKAKDANIFIRVTSSLPDWEKEEDYQGYHFLEIGLAQEREFRPSERMEDSENLHQQIIQVRINGLINILTAMGKIDEKSKTKINYAHQHVLITSYCGTPISSTDINILSSFEDKIIMLKIRVGATTKTLLCQKLKKMMPDSHLCEACEAGPSTKKISEASSSGPSTHSSISEQQDEGNDVSHDV